MYVLMYSTCYFCQIVNKLGFSRQILEKFSNIEINGTPSSGSRIDPRGLTDRHDEANTRFSQFYDSVYIGLKSCFTNHILEQGKFSPHPTETF